MDCQKTPSSLWTASDRHVDISRDARVWKGFGDVAITRSSKLLVVFKEGDGHGVWDCRWSKLCLVESTDGGRTWGNRRVLVDAGRLEMRSDGGWAPYDYQRWLDDKAMPLRGWMIDVGKMSSLSDGTMMITTCCRDMCDSAKPVGFNLFSHDEGQSWIDPVPCGFPVYGPSRTAETASGELLTLGGAGQNQVWASSDRGQHWRQVSELPAVTWYRPAEVGLTRREDGSIVLIQGTRQIGETTLQGWPAHRTASSWQRLRGTQ